MAHLRTHRDTPARREGDRAKRACPARPCWLLEVRIDVVANGGLARRLGRLCAAGRGSGASRVVDLRSLRAAAGVVDSDRKRPRARWLSVGCAGRRALHRRGGLSGPPRQRHAHARCPAAGAGQRRSPSGIPDRELRPPAGRSRRAFQSGRRQPPLHRALDRRDGHLHSSGVDKTASSAVIRWRQSASSSCRHARARAISSGEARTCR